MTIPIPRDQTGWRLTLVCYDQRNRDPEEIYRAISIHGFARSIVVADVMESVDIRCELVAPVDELDE